MAQQKTQQQKPEPTKAVETVKTSALAWGESPVTGFESVTAEDLGIPFLTIVQKGSAEFDKAHPRHAEKKIPGCDVGDIIDIISRSVVHKSGGPPLVVVPVAWVKYYMEWRPRTTGGGGVVKAHTDPTLLNTCKRNEKNLDVLPNGNILVTTAYFSVVTIGEDGGIGKRYMLGMSSTQLRKSRAWLNMAQSIKVRTPNGQLVTPPLFSHSYKLSTMPESNEKGSWMGWKIEVNEMVTDLTLAEELIATAKLSKTTAENDALRGAQAEEDVV